ncbi:CHAT domain-containing protein [Candidatus Albibeggiatoa sp. nov. BB20]|uniref:CHAT domain-containing protein n=1 Tax=Candidatus Albibeggiatoa sp. nov. BB20 TaxID=3162723 RepID=UPI003365736A
MKPLKYNKIIYLPLFIVCVWLPNWVYALSAEQWLQQGQAYFKQGQYEQAIQHWEGGLDSLSIDDLNQNQKIDLHAQIAHAHQSLGNSDKAIQLLERNLPLVESDISQHILLLAALSDLCLATHQYIKARQYINQAVNKLEIEQVSSSISAMVFNNLGNVLAVEAYFDEAISVYQQALTHTDSEQPELQIRVLVNLSRTYLKNHQFKQATNSLQQAYQALIIREDKYDKAFLLITVGELAQNIQKQQQEYQINGKSRQQLRQLAYESLSTSVKIAEQIHNDRLIAYAYGYLGQLYESEKRYEDSLKLTRRAIFAAQESEAYEILYRWEWQAGRLFQIQKQLDLAIVAYQHAVKSLQAVRDELKTGYRKTSLPFRETIGLVYFELADLLLQKAKTDADPKWLIEARDTIELLKTVELQDYFQDDCLRQSSTTLAEQMNMAKTAVYYPILLHDRLEILLSLPKGIKHFTVNITALKLKDEANEFRFELETRETKDYLPYAQRLYRWMITPILAELKRQQVDTLVFVPDGVLRTIPFSALHNGSHFLIEDYAIATVPSLTLTDPTPLAKKADVKILLNGLSQSVQGFPQLSSVTREVRFIERFYPQQSQILLDNEFTTANFANSLRQTPYSIVHIASHGQFNSDPQKTFLLTYDNKITISHLEDLIRLSKIRNEPMELLTLSACQTAVGDDQAALGLAGIAVKAGARSALATLWFIDDAATSLLVSEFYQQLQIKHVTKAKALQKAQLYLLNKPRYQHPAFWAPFLLVGNWL